MQPGDKVFWIRHDRDTGSHTRTRVPAVYIGLKSKKERDSATVFTLVDGAVEKKTIKLTNILPRDMEKEIDEAITGLAFYNGPRVTDPQMSALAWLKNNGGLEVPNMDLNGRSKEWPRHKTLEGLQERGLITVEQKETYWRAKVNPLGEAVLQEHHAGVPKRSGEREKMLSATNQAV
jgi:hypothetical protein